MNKILLISEREYALAEELSQHCDRSDIDVLQADVLHAKDAVTALTLALMEKPALIILDRDLPDGNSTMIKRLLKNFRLLKQTPILYLKDGRIWKSPKSASTEDTAARLKKSYFSDEAFETIKAILWSALFTSESIRNYAMLRKGEIDNLDKLEKYNKAPVPESELASVAGKIAKASGTLNILDAAIDYNVQSYIDCIEQSLKYPKDVFEEQFRLISEEVSQEADLSHRLMRRLELFKKHVDLYKRGGEKISPEVVRQDIVPEIAR